MIYVFVIVKELMNVKLGLWKKILSNKSKLVSKSHLMHLQPKKKKKKKQKQVHNQAQQTINFTE